MVNIKNIMLAKKYSKDKKNCVITFDLPAEVNAQTVLLCGDFTEWADASKEMEQQEDGSFSITVSLPAEREYAFRYLLDNERWENEPEADDYAPNPFGSQKSVIKV